MNRREFIQQTLIGATTAATLNLTAEAKVNWPIGCFNRPWTKWSYDQTLMEIKAAGYKSTGLLSGCWPMTPPATWTFCSRMAATTSLAVRLRAAILSGLSQMRMA